MVKISLHALVEVFLQAMDREEVAKGIMDLSHLEVIAQEELMEILIQDLQEMVDQKETVKGIMHLSHLEVIAQEE